MSSKAEKIFKAKMCEQAERYEDMVKVFKEITDSKVELEVEERNLLSAAFKNQIGSRRTAFRALTAIEQKEESKKDSKSDNVKLIKTFKKKIEEEISGICNEVVTLIDEKLLPAATKDDVKLFYIKMKGDYYRYYCECLSGDKLKEIGEKARAAYDDATKNAEKSLPVTDSIRLGLALNFSVFHYEILNDPQKACKIAKEAFDNAISQLEGLEDEQYKESASILQLLRDNLTLWQNDTNEAEQVEQIN
jgi:14-3-3 protein epsilon